MKAILVAGGKGERLRPLTNHLPKPMIEVGGKSILEHNINIFKKHGITDFIISVCYLPQKITEYFGNGEKFGVNIKYIYEKEDFPLGTAGNIGEAQKFINAPFIVTYADILRDLDISGMIKFHQKKKALATINIYKRYGKNPKSMVVFDKDKKITSFIERPNEENLPADFVWANGSFYIFEPEVFDFIPHNKCTDFGKDVFTALLDKRKNFYAYLSDGFFIDIGNMEKLKKARELIKTSSAQIH